jgi:hypothetical protein
MLVGVQPVPSAKLDLEHPHEVADVIGCEVHERTPVGHFALKIGFMGFSPSHLAILDARAVTTQHQGVSRVKSLCCETLAAAVEE